MRAYRQAGGSASESVTTGGLQRSPGKQTLVEASAPAPAARPAVPANEVIQRQEVPRVGGGSGACLDPDAVRADLERIGGEIEDVRRRIDPDGAGGGGVALPASCTERLRGLSDQLETLRPLVDGCHDPATGGPLRALYRRTQDALLAAFQTLAAYNADQTLQAWSTASDEDRAAQRAEYHAESGGLGNDADWCGMFADAQYRAAGMHGALDMVFNSTFHTEQFFSYGTGSSNSPRLIQPHGTGEPIDVKTYHGQRGSLRSWLVGGAIGDDIRPGDVVTLSWFGTSAAADHICIVRSYTPGSGDQPGELITIDGNAYGARKPGAASPDWDHLEEDDMANLGSARTSDVSTSHYETGLGEGRTSLAQNAGPAFNRDRMLEGNTADVYHAMTVQGRGRPSLVDFEPDHVYFNAAGGTSFKDAGRPGGPIQRRPRGGGGGTSAQIQRSEAGAVATADPAGAFDAATRGAASEIPYRDEMQRRFRADFSAVRAYAGRDLTALGARAATRGDQVAFASPTPDRELVAHELTHVLQARAGGVGGAAVSDPGDASEREARAAAAEVSAGRPASLDAGSAAPSAEIHRHEDDGREGPPKPLPPVQPEPGQAGGFRLDWDAFYGITMELPNGAQIDSIREIYDFALLRHLPEQFPDLCRHASIPPEDGGRARSAERHAAVLSITSAIRLQMQRLLGAGDRDGAEQMRVRLFIANQQAIVDALQVETSQRYGQSSSATFCNIYAYDVVTAMGGYLPRVWWTDEAIAAIQHGAEFVSKAEYDQRVHENTESHVSVVTNLDPTWVHQQEADALMRWMRLWGASFGWHQVPSAQAAQASANEGRIVIILGRKGAIGDDARGHVSVVLAESEHHHAPADTADGAYVPLQSQAGARNFSYNDTTTGSAARGAWWTNPAFTDAGFFEYRGDHRADAAIRPPEWVGTELPGPRPERHGQTLE